LERRVSIASIARPIRVDQVSDVLIHNLAALDHASGGIVMMTGKVKLLAVGAGPTLDYPDATSFFNELEKLIDMVLQQHIN
jgi:hypothetical protein